MRKRPDYGDATPEDVARALLKRKRRASDTPDGDDPPSNSEELEHVQTRAEPEASASCDRSRKS